MKYQFGVFTRKKFVTSHYHIIYVVKNPLSYTFNKVEHYPEDVWSIKREYWKGRQKTPTKLPSELVRKILDFSSNPGDIVLDPFLGSGTVAVVSREMGGGSLALRSWKTTMSLRKRGWRKHGQMQRVSRGHGKRLLFRI